jgi:hypothetical protein
VICTAVLASSRIGRETALQTRRQQTDTNKENSIISMAIFT